MKKFSLKNQYFLNKRVVFFLIPVLALIIVLVSINGHSSLINENTNVAMVNGEPISFREFKQSLIRNRASIYSYFKQKYGVDHSSKFWESSYGGESTIGTSRKRALDECVRTKVVQILFKQKGLMKDIRYSSFLEEFKAENIRRENAVKNKQVIYGPVQYEESYYFGYVFNNTVTKLKEKLGEKELCAKDEELKKYYETNRDKLFKKEDYIRVQKLSIPYIGEVEANAKEKIEQVKARVDVGERFEDIVKSFNEKNMPKLTCEEQVFDEKTSRTDSRLNMELKDTAKKLIVGQVSGVFKSNGKFCIIKCVEKREGGYSTFIECKEVIKLKYIDKKFQELIEKLVKEAKIEINRSVYESVTVE
jgi:parvulin-like peptidyl-prolyl isomerase